MSFAKIPVLIFLSLLFGGCGQIQAAYPQVSAKALSFYQEGSFRHSSKVLLAQKSLTLKDKYLLARDFIELKEYDKAVGILTNLKVSDFRKIPDKSFFLPRYIVSTTRALYRSPKAYSNSLRILSNLIPALSSPEFLTDVMDIDAYYQWKSHQTNYFLGKANASPEFQRFARLILGKQKKINPLKLLDDYRYSDFKNAYKEYFARFPLSSLKHKRDFVTLIRAELHFHHFKKARAAVKRYYKLNRDKDFYKRNIALILYRQGKRKKALNSLIRFSKSGRASRKTLKLASSWCKRRRYYHGGLALSARGIRRYGAYFYPDYLFFLGHLGYHKTIWKWYRHHRTSRAFRKLYGTRIVRLLLRTSPSLARKVMNSILKRKQNYAVLLMSALLYYERGYKKRAYREFLRILMTYPVTYEWLVAQRYDKILRKRYPSLFRHAFKKAVRLLPQKNVKIRLDRAMAYRELAPSLFYSLYRETRYQNELRAYRKNLFIKFQTTKKIPTLERLASNPLLVWNQEWKSFIKNELKKSARGNEIYRLTYRYRLLLKKADDQGLLVSQLNSYSLSLLKSRRFHLLLPDSVLKELYPLAPLSTIQAQSADTNTALWILSAFREESHFHKTAVSRMGAQGYAQIMPATARLLKRNLRHPEWSIYDYRDNVNMGIILYKHLFKRYHGQYTYALGAYNAGEGAVNHWKRRYKRYKTELWIECVEYKETRNYIKKIMLTRYFYQQIYGFSPAPYTVFGKPNKKRFK